MSDDNDSGQLVPLEALGLQSADQLSSELDVLTKTSDYLPQLRVYGSEAGIVKERKFPMGHLGLYFSGNNIVDLGVSFDCICVAARPRAAIVMGEQPVSFYKFDSPEFQDVLEKAKAKMPGYLSGLEYLLWIPKVNQYGLFLMGSITLRRESPNMKALIGKGATIAIKLIKTAKYTWHGCNIFPCSVPMALPDMEGLQDEVEKFKNPKESQVELAEEDTSGRTR